MLLYDARSRDFRCPLRHRSVAQSHWARLLIAVAMVLGFAGCGFAAGPGSPSPASRPGRGPISLDSSSALPMASSARRAGVDVPVHQTRSGGGPASLRSSLEHASRARGRERADRGAVPRAQLSLYTRAARGGAAHGLAAPRVRAHPRRGLDASPCRPCSAIARRKFQRVSEPSKKLGTPPQIWTDSIGEALTSDRHTCRHT